MPNKTIDINEFAIKNYVESVRPENLEIRKQVDIGYSYDKKVVLLFEIRPFWDNPDEYQNLEYAKIRYYASREKWQLYWMRASGKWELYKPFPESSHLQKMLDVVKEDELGCFIG